MHERLLWITHPACRLHDMGKWHPESPLRLAAIDDRLSKSGLLRQFTTLEAPLASREALLAVHAPEHVDFVLQAKPGDGLVRIDADTAMNAHSAQAAQAAAGAVLAGVDSVLRRRARFVFCAVRPPGHHAEAAQAMGFCLFSSVAVGAAHALARGLERVAILDFDVHYGNGSAKIFAGDPRVLVCNSFQQQIYPYWHAGGVANCVDAPLSGGDGSAEFREAIDRIWAPALARHEPQLILVSAGFDAHADEPLAGLALSEEDYGWIGRRIRGWADEYCDGHVVASLEGGYDLRALAASVEAFVREFCID